VIRRTAKKTFFAGFLQLRKKTAAVKAEHNVRITYDFTLRMHAAQNKKRNDKSTKSEFGDIT